MADPNFGYSQQTLQDGADEANIYAFIVAQLLAQVSTMKLVQVQAVHAAGEDEPPTVDVLPLVNQIDGGDNSTPHGTVYGLPIFRLQGGASAIICDPVVGDIGMVICADRDSSAVRASRGQANPGSRRKFDLADGVYLGTVLSLAPTCQIKFTEGGFVRIVDAGGNVLQTSAAGIDVTLAPGGHFKVNGIGATTHTHTSAAPGVQTLPPTPGT